MRGENGSEGPPGPVGPPGIPGSEGPKVCEVFREKNFYTSFPQFSFKNYFEKLIFRVVKVIAALWVIEVFLDLQESP